MTQRFNGVVIHHTCGECGKKIITKIEAPLHDEYKLNSFIEILRKVFGDGYATGVCCTKCSEKKLKEVK